MLVCSGIQITGSRFVSRTTVGRRIGNVEPRGAWLPEGLRKFQGGLCIVCGPPAAGKSTYCREQAAETDHVVDLDEITSELSGCPVHKTKSLWLQRGLAVRDQRLRDLARQPEAMTWFIVGAPRAREREWWYGRLRPTSVVVLETPATECIRRCEADSARSSNGRNYRHLINRWWSLYTRRAGDVVYTFQ
jgi:hypothetical protein